MKHLDATDLPSDTNGALGKLRTVLLATYNNSRVSADRRSLLLKTLKFVVLHIEHGIKAEDKVKAELEAKEIKATRAVEVKLAQKPVKPTTTKTK